MEKEICDESAPSGYGAGGAEAPPACKTIQAQECHPINPPVCKKTKDEVCTVIQTPVCPKKSKENFANGCLMINQKPKHGRNARLNTKTMKLPTQPNKRNTVQEHQEQSITIV